MVVEGIEESKGDRERNREGRLEIKGKVEKGGEKSVEWRREN